MSKRSHMWIGMLTALNIIHGLSSIEVLKFLAVVLGSIFPDMDMAWNKNKKPFRERTLLSHRGITHHPLVVLLLLIIGFYEREVNIMFGVLILCFTVGVVLHDFLDMFSPLGIPIGLNYRKRLAVKLYKTGELSEYLLVALLTVVLLVPIFVRVNKAYAEDRFKLGKMYNRYLQLSDNKTVKKYNYLVKQAEKNIQSHKRNAYSAEESYDYYTKYILPYVKKNVQSLGGSRYSRKYGTVLGRNDYVYVFMSSSVPRSTWENYIKAIDFLRKSGQDGIGIILRGCIGGCTKVLPTAKFVFSLLKHGNEMYRVPILIDPLLYRLFNVTRVPTIVYAKNVNLRYSWLSPGVKGNLKDTVTAYKIIGDCGFAYALGELYRESGDSAMLKLYDILTTGWLEK